ncbi:MAG TPA: type II toxin-antitoxin system VapC family toxin [Lichenihabitans sp.]|jgi:ribonuclease VapC|nr:type II toxin-antitoxin system VapC family toxin [Lichenihabitans sp.]
MIVVDSSAVVAIRLEEPERDRFVAALVQSDRSCMSAVNVYETAVVLRQRSGSPAVDLVSEFLSDFGIEIVPFDHIQARAASLAYDRYGKGIDAKAKLNLADCAAYALAKTLDVPLLFKGQDFAETDIRFCL